MGKLACLLVLVCACGEVIDGGGPVTVTISPPTPVTTDDLVANVSDGDGRTLSYRWTATGQPSAMGATLSASATTKGDVWTVDVLESGDVVGSAMVTIADAPPTVTTPTFSAPTWATAPLRCVAAAIDPDGDAVTLSVAWELNGAAYAGMPATTVNANDTIPKATTKTDEAYKCIVTATSGGVTGKGEASVTITPRLVYTVTEGAGSILQTLDLDTGTLTNIGPTGVTYQFGDLAWDRVEQKLYMIDGRPTNALYSINTTTGAATLIGTHGLLDMFALAATSSGLYGVTTGATNTLYKLNTTTGVATIVGNMGATTGRIEGLVFDSAHNRVVGESTQGVAYVIDLTAGTAVSLGGSAPSDDFGLTYDPYVDRYYRNTYSGQLFQVDPVTFAATPLKSGLSNHTSIALPLPPP